MFVLRILEEPISNTIQHAKLEIQSRLPRRVEVITIEEEKSFYFELSVDYGKLNELAEWMKYCGYKITVSRQP